VRAARKPESVSRGASEVASRGVRQPIDEEAPIQYGVVANARGKVKPATLMSSKRIK
jgi:hypothetical protein